MKNIMRLVAALFLSVCLAGTAFAEQTIQIKGSDTLINLVQRLSEVYMEQYSDDYIAVTGGGSGTGIAALINKKTDIANSSRGIKPKEVDNAVAAGVTPKRVVIGMDGLSVIVNGKSPIKKLTVQEIGNIFSGAITNWKEVGGPDMPITLYGRQSNSGTFVFFRDEVVKADYAATMNKMNGNAQIVEAVKQDATGIGYVGVGYVKNSAGLNVLEVASRSGAAYASPLNAADVKSGKYPISRPLNQYINGTPQGAVKDFIAFELSDEGQRIVEEEGFFPLPDDYIKYNQQSVGL